MIISTFAGSMCENRPNIPSDIDFLAVLGSTIVMGVGPTNVNDILSSPTLL